ncbi:MAG: ATP-binding protein, partial [Planctomycetes bacterium]|nr:ATP-binding protein [Planctomycetota bacterium]
MKQKTQKTGSAIMRPRARIISLIGDELISDESVAVVELVRNAYDADATNVSVIFEGKDLSTLTISDNGVGMTLETVKTGWFEPGTVLKKREKHSPSGRIYLGAKGIGRFAAARIGEALVMQTKIQNESEGVTVLLDWGRFDDESYLDEITLDYEIGPIEHLKHGTILELSNLHARKYWLEEDFRTLHTRLSRLISPFETDTKKSEATNFEINLSIPGYPDLTGKVQPHELTNKPKYRLIGSLSPEGIFNGEIEFDGKSVKKFNKKKLGSKGETVLCGLFEVEIRAWDRDRPGLSPFMLQFNQSLSGIRKILDEYCGVSIYRDGFRVYPYGEKGIDWLSLDTRSRQTPTLRLANNQIIAAIRLSRHDNPKLIDRTTREGLVHNHEYLALTTWFKRILALLEAERYTARPREETKPEELSTLFEPFDISDVVAEANKQLGKAHPVSKMVRKKDTDIREGVKRLQDHYSRVLLAAGLGQLVDLVIHEIGSPLGRVTRDVGYLEKLLMGTFSSNALDKLLGRGAHKKLENTFIKLKAWLEQIGNLREKLIPKAAGKRGRTSSFVVQDEINDNLALFEGLITKQKIACKLRAPSQKIVVHMSRSNLGQIIANLLDNSIYWLTRHHGDGKGGKIDIHVTTLKNGFRIRFSDDGPGVAEEDVELIFDQEFSRKPHGMGLGLFIARQVIEPYGKLIYR